MISAWLTLMFWAVIIGLSVAAGLKFIANKHGFDRIDDWLDYRDERNHIARVNQNVISIIERLIHTAKPLLMRTNFEKEHQEINLIDGYPFSRRTDEFKVAGLVCSIDYDLGTFSILGLSAEICTSIRVDGKLSANEFDQAEKLLISHYKWLKNNDLLELDLE